MRIEARISSFVPEIRREDAMGDGSSRVPPALVVRSSNRSWVDTDLRSIKIRRVRLMHWVVMPEM